LLIPAIDTHCELLGCVPRLVAADAAFYSARNEAAAKAKGVKRFCVPNRSTKSLTQTQKKRWFRNGQKWRTGCEGRVSVVKRRDTASAVAATRDLLEWSAGSAVASSPTTSSTSASLWIKQRSLSKLFATIGFLSPPAIPAGFALPGAIDHNARKPQFCTRK
jgi:hypothetical protein